jgi:hypothetical protein
MADCPPINESIMIAVAKLVDDSQESDRRDPAHSDLEFLINNSGLQAADPSKQGRPVGKSKRIKTVLNWAISNNIGAGEKLVTSIISTVQGYGGFRTESSNFCGNEAIANLVSAFSLVGWELSIDGALYPKVLPVFGTKGATQALKIYAERARNGSIDSPLLAGTAKDLLEATAAHVLTIKWGSYSQSQNFPTLLGQAFTALGFATPTEAVSSGEAANKRVERSAYDLACALNNLRNKQGTGHGRPWNSTVTKAQAIYAVESMGNLASLMLNELS